MRRLLLIFLLTCPSLAQTTISIPAASGGGVKLTLNERPGINIDQNTYFGNQQYAANLLASFNTSFAQQIGSQFSRAKSCGSTTSWIDDNSGSTQPTNFQQGATYQVISGADNGLSGTITASAAASGSNGQTLTLSPTLTTPCSAGDYMVIRCRTSGGTCGGGQTTANIGFTISGTSSLETSDVSPSSGSNQALSLATGGSMLVPFDATVSGAIYINLNGTYTLTYRAKGTTGAPVVGYTVSHGGTTYLNASDTPTVSGTSGVGWTNYSHQFTATENGSQSAVGGQVQLSITGTGTALIQDVYLTESGTGSNTSYLRNAVFARLSAMAPGTVRWMESPIYGCTFDNLIAAPTARRVCYTSANQALGVTASGSLNDYLLAMAEIGADPFWTFSVYSTATDMVNMAAYFNASCASGNAYATIRCNFLSGTPYAGETWTQIFANIYLEMGNEVWNGGNSDNLTFNSLAYGNIVGANAQALHGAAFYNSKIKMLASGWAGYGSPNPSGSWGDALLGQAQSVGSLPDGITGSGYSFPYITDLTTSAIFPAMFAEGPNYSTVQTFSSVPATGMTYQLGNFYQTKYGIPGYIYEMNISAQCGLSGIGITQTTLNQTLAGIGGALSLAQNILLGARDAGIGVQNVWSLVEDGNTFDLAAANHGSSCSTNSGFSAPIFGVNRIMGGPTNTQAVDRPSAIALQLINAAVGSKLKLLNTTQTSTPTYSQAGAQPDPTQTSLTNSIAANAAVRYTQATAFGDGAGNYALVVLCLNPSATCPITFTGAAAPTGTVTKTVLTSTNITDNNESINLGGTPVVTTPSSTTLSSPTSDTPPAFSMTTYTWQVGSTPTGTQFSGVMSGKIGQ
jgi:hypothetical protein